MKTHFLGHITMSLKLSVGILHRSNIPIAERSGAKFILMKHLFTVIVAVVMMITLPHIAISADSDSGDASISDFKAYPLYRSVKLKWKVKTPLKKGVTFQIIRSDSFVEGPYEEIATIPYVKEKKRYTYIDKKFRGESDFFYKLDVTGAGKTYGPISSRPTFSRPST